MPRDTLDTVGDFVGQLKKAHDEAESRATALNEALLAKKQAEKALQEVVEKKLRDAKTDQEAAKALAMHFILGGVEGQSTPLAPGSKGLMIVYGVGMTCLRYWEPINEQRYWYTLAIRIPTPHANPIFLIARDMPKTALLSGEDVAKLVEKYFLTYGYLRSSTLADMFSREH